MTRKEALLLLEEWNETHNRIEKAYRMMNDALGMAPESPVGVAMWKTFELYTEQLELRLCPDGMAHWLDWFCWDNDMGTKGLGVHLLGKTPVDKEIMVSIRNLEDLADVLGYKEEAE